MEFKIKYYKPKAIMIDFFGTITPISWEQEYVYPYIMKTLDEYIVKNWLKLNKYITTLRAESIEHHFHYNYYDAPVIDEDDEKSVQKTSLDYIKWQINKKKQSKSTNAIEQMIWEYGFNNGQLKLKIFDDVKQELQKWTKENIIVYLLTPFDEKNSKLVLSHTTDGDLTSLISGYFDNKSINIKDEKLFTEIISKINIEPKKILLITHFARGGKAAATTKMEVVLIIRDGNQRIREHYATLFNFIETFSDLYFIEKL